MIDFRHILLPWKNGAKIIYFFNLPFRVSISCENMIIPMVGGELLYGYFCFFTGIQGSKTMYDIEMSAEGVMSYSISSQDKVKYIWQLHGYGSYQYISHHYPL